MNSVLSLILALTFSSVATAAPTMIRTWMLKERHCSGGTPVKDDFIRRGDWVELIFKEDGRWSSAVVRSSLVALANGEFVTQGQTLRFQHLDGDFAPLPNGNSQVVVEDDRLVISTEAAASLGYCPAGDTLESTFKTPN